MDGRQEENEYDDVPAGEQNSDEDSEGSEKTIQDPGEDKAFPDKEPRSSSVSEVQGSSHSGDVQVTWVMAMLIYMSSWLTLIAATVRKVIGIGSRKIYLRELCSGRHLLRLWAVIFVLVTVGTFFYYSGLRRRSAVIGVVVGGNTAAADISRHPVWPNMEAGIDRCIPTKETEDVNIQSFFRDASVAQADDMNHAMNRYLYFAIMHAVVLGSRFADPAMPILPGQKVGKDDVDRYLRILLETMQGEVIVASQDATAQFNEMNRFLYLTIVQGSVLRSRYPQPGPTLIEPAEPSVIIPPVDPVGPGTIEVLQKQFKETETKVSYMEVQLQEKETKVDYMEVQLEEKETKITYMEVQLQEKETKITYMETQLLEKEKRIMYLEQQLQYTKVELSELHSTCNSWQVRLKDCQASKDSTCADCREKLNDCQARKGSGEDDPDW